MLNTMRPFSTLRRVRAFAMSNAEYLLKSFAVFAAERGQVYIHFGATAIDSGPRSGPSVRTRCSTEGRMARRSPLSASKMMRHELPRPITSAQRPARRRPPHHLARARRLGA